MTVKPSKVTGLSLALMAQKTTFLKNQHLLQGIEAGAEDHDIDAEPEDEDPFASLTQTLTVIVTLIVTNSLCLCCCFDKNISWYSSSAKLDSLENN